MDLRRHEPRSGATLRLCNVACALLARSPFAPHLARGSPRTKFRASGASRPGRCGASHPADSPETERGNSNVGLRPELRDGCARRRRRRGPLRSMQACAPT